MNIELTWDLFIGVFILMIVAYSFIVGINGTLKILLSTYIAILTVDGIHSFVYKFLSGNILDYLGFMDNSSGTAIVKISLFIILLVTFTIKGRFEPIFNSTTFYSLEFLFVPIFGLFCAGLMVGTIILYTLGGGIFNGIDILSSEVIQGLKDQSILIKIFTDYFSLLFAIPALGILFLSLIEEE